VLPLIESGLVHPAVEAIASASTGTHAANSKRPFLLIDRAFRGY
jgi:hypothetical protein